jgi:hypothetical protein
MQVAHLHSLCLDSPNSLYPGNGTSIRTSTPISSNAAQFTSVAPARSPSTFAFLFCLLVTISFLAQGIAAIDMPNTVPATKDRCPAHVPRDLPSPSTTALNLYERGSNPLIDFTNLVGSYLGGKLNSGADPQTGKFVKDTFVAEFKSAMCNWGYSGVLLGKLLAWDLVADCTAIVLRIGWSGGIAGEFAAVLLASTSCNYAASWYMTHMTGLKDLQLLLDEICGHITEPQANACSYLPSNDVAKRDLLNDPENCGLCGRKVHSLPLDRESP